MKKSLYWFLGLSAIIIAVACLTMKDPFLAIGYMILPLAVFFLCIVGMNALTPLENRKDVMPCWDDTPKQKIKAPSLLTGLRCLGTAILMVIALILLVWLVLTGVCVLGMGMS